MSKSLKMVGMLAATVAVLTMACVLGCDADDPDKLCCTCMREAHCLYDTPEDKANIVNWCRGILEEGDELPYDDDCLTEYCVDECEGILW
jgi:hypothetical protein